MRAKLTQEGFMPELLLEVTRSYLGPCRSLLEDRGSCTVKQAGPIFSKVSLHFVSFPKWRVRWAGSARSTHSASR